MAEYFMNRPFLFRDPDDKPEWFEEIRTVCNDLAPNDKLRIYGFGNNMQYMLDIYKDEDEDIRIFTTYAVIGEIVEEVDKSDHISQTPQGQSYLLEELSRIWDGKNMGID